MKRSILVVDDRQDQLDLLVATLERESDFRVVSTTSPRSALELVRSEAPDAVITDLVMPDLSGVDLTRALRVEYPSLPILVLTGRHDAAAAQEAFEAGATDFMTKPPDPGFLVTRLRHAVEEVPARELLHQANRQRFDKRGILGEHPRIAEVRVFVEQVALVPRVPALILGESGTGKNLVARAIHAAGAESRQRFVEINCAALPANLLEAELFGYEKGAFTDARQTKRGLAEIADAGTLMLDEIGTMPSDVQAKLLSFLESRTFRRVGGTRDISVELRVVAATNLDLEAAVAAGTFREDLFYRLNVATIVLPTLREIRSDIPILAHHFAQRAAEYFRKPVPRLDPASLRSLEAYDWPGNARELRNIIERALIFAQGEWLVVQPPSQSQTPPPTERGDDTLSLPLGLTLEEVERRYLVATLEDSDGNVGEAAARLGLTRKVFWARRRKHGLLGDPGP